MATAGFSGLSLHHTTIAVSDARSVGSALQGVALPLAFESGAASLTNGIAVTCGKNPPAYFLCSMRLVENSHRKKSGDYYLFFLEQVKTQVPV